MNRAIDKLLDTLHRANLANQGLRSYPRIPMLWRWYMPSNSVPVIVARIAERMAESLPCAISHTERFDDEPIFGRETPDDLQLLYRPYHKEKHLDLDGYFPPDAELNSNSKL
jgi:hypothetical protein